MRLLQRWRDEATKAGRWVKRIAVAFEAGRDGFWLARWLRTRGIEADVIHASSVAVSREHRRAKTDRLDVELLQRAFLGWLRGERDHCKMAAIPTLELEDARWPSRERETLVGDRTRIINRMKSTLARLGIRNFRPNLRKARERLGALGIVNLTRSSRPSWPLSLERGQPYRGAKDFSVPNRRATDGRRIPPLLKLTMPLSVSNPLRRPGPVAAPN